MHLCVCAENQANADQNQQANEENKQAILLFAIVTFFLVFNSPRNFLDLYETLNFDRIKEDYDNQCGGLALYILLIGAVSKIFLSVNSSMNFFIYSVMSTTFRKELKKIVEKLVFIRGRRASDSTQMVTTTTTAVHTTTTGKVASASNV